MLRVRWEQQRSHGLAVKAGESGEASAQAVWGTRGMGEETAGEHLWGKGPLTCLSWETTGLLGESGLPWVLAFHPLGRTTSSGAASIPESRRY